MTLRTHEIDVTRLVPVMPLESSIVTLELRTENNEKGNLCSRYILKTVVGDLVELDNYKKEQEAKNNE